MIHSAQEMSKVLNGNGNGNGHGTQSLLRQIEKKVARAKAAASPHAIKESGVTFQTAEGVELRGALSHVTRHTVIFELHNPDATLRLSETFAGFEIIFQERTVYSGRATVCSVVKAGAKFICEATLKEEDWKDLNPTTAPQSNGEVAKEFKNFLKEWQKLYKVSPEFKVAVADLQTFLYDLRLWLGQIELRIHSTSDADGLLLEKKIGLEIGKSASVALTKMFEKFEDICRCADPDILGAYSAFAKRMLHPLLLCSPFMHRIYNKPLGYPGDYEMVNMILRDPYEGDSLFAKLLNVFILSQVPAEAHRNRIIHLVQKLVEETNRVTQCGGICRIYNLGCGPAGEVQLFLARYNLSAFSQFTLLDADDETLKYAKKVLERIKSENGRKTKIKFIKKSVFQLLKTGGENKNADEKYDFIYSAGLFDYLNDQVGRTIIKIGYDQLAPGGLLLITNVDPVNPIRNIMERIYEWHLIYRDNNQIAALTSELPLDAAIVIKGDPTSANMILEVRKPS
jgi:extracellular factor (EF) 3-hydroxypalmitic acid methyl ester biosynthesis protein